MSGIHDRIRQNKRDKEQRRQFEETWFQLDAIISESRDRGNFPVDVRVVESRG